MPYVCIMDDLKFMNRALELAANGKGSVSPNPMVGCVIVYDNKIIGEGWHKEFGGPHAEVMAVESVADKTLIGESVIYVTLEPCSYHGKTPACTDLLMTYLPRRVVVACLDPNPQVSGKGVEILRSAGIDVDFGVLESEAKALNKQFFVSMNTQRPYIILKWAQTADGFIARLNYDSKWISSPLSRQLVHKWRSEEDGILVGYNTVKYDNPELSVRDWEGRNPVRIVIDPHGKLEGQAKVFDSSVKTYWFNGREDLSSPNLVVKRFPKEHTLLDGLEFLYKENIGSVIVEGGAAILQQFIKDGLWDEARIFTSQARFAEGIRAPGLELLPDSEQFIEEDRLSIIFNPETAEFWQKN